MHKQDYPHKILQVASGNFFSTYGGGQVYVKNIVDEMIRQHCSLVVFSFLNNLDVIKKKDYKGIDLYRERRTTTIDTNYPT